MSDVIQSTGTFFNFVDGKNIARQVVRVKMLDSYYQYSVEHLDTSKFVSGDQVKIFLSGFPLRRVVGICDLKSTWAGEWKDLEDFLS